MINDLYQRSGGTETYLFNLFNGLEERGHVVVVIYGIKTMFDNGIKNRLSYFVDFNQPIQLIRENITDVIKRESPDILHTHNLGQRGAILYSYINEWCSSIPVVVSIHVHSLYCPSGLKYFYNGPHICQRRYGVYCLLSMLLNRCFDSKRPWISLNFYNRSRQFLSHCYVFKKIIVSSEFMKSCLVDKRGLKKEDIEVLPFFTELPELNEYQDENTVLFAGRIYKEKGLDYLIKAMQYINVSFKLLVVGKGRELNNCKKLACKMGLEDKIKFVGWEFDCGEYYRKASVVVIPSIWPEPYGIVGIEAMSYAKPVVAFNVGGIPEWLQDKQTGFLVRPYDIKEMAAKIELLLRDKTLAMRMGQQGRIMAEERFNKNRHVKRLLEIYGELKRRFKV